MNERISLYKEKTKCCGCGACMNICPKKAIRMMEDEYGFLYPKIDTYKCIACGLCKKVCGYQKGNMIQAETEKEVYAAVSSDDKLLNLSASGGVFSCIATDLLQDGGFVCGCSMEFKNEMLSPEHILIDSTDKLYKLQGSKYVQSNSLQIYGKIKEKLEEERKVLFSGTPCQVAALKEFLGKEYEKLYTIDIICHGTPSARIFQDYIKNLEKQIKGRIEEFKFRDKSNGWGLKGSVEYIDQKGKKKKKIIPVQLSSYYKLFQDALIYRENCYSCKYAGQNRVGDLTIGDFWGIVDAHPEYIMTNGGNMDERKGVSCVLINNAHGKYLLNKYGNKLQLQPSDFTKVVAQNDQLIRPSNRSILRDKVLEIYKDKGYAAVEKWYFRRMGIKKYVYILWNKLPAKIKYWLRRLQN